MDIICNTCDVAKDENEFSYRSKAKKIRHRKCKPCQKAYSATHYVDNKEDYIVRAHENNPIYIQRNREFLYNYLLEHPCVDCGESDPVVLHFDHLRDKVENVGALVRGCSSIKRIQEEIDKCEVRCANCHMRKTAERHGGWFKMKYTMA